jgi:hypothetical protein
VRPVIITPISAFCRSVEPRSIIGFPHRPGLSSGACGCTWSWPGWAWWPAGRGTDPSCAITPVVHHDGAAHDRLQWTELVRHQHDRPSKVDEFAQPPRRTPPATPRPRPRSVRRGPAAPARPRGHARSGCAAAGRPTASRPGRRAVGSPTAGIASARPPIARRAGAGSRAVPSRARGDHLPHGGGHAAACANRCGT